MDLDALYKQLVLEESRNPEHRHHIADSTHEGEGKNPSCGDELTLQFKIKDDIIEDCAFTGVGCAISQASASIMSGLLIGKKVSEAKVLLKDFLRLIREGNVEADAEEALGDAIALQDISHMPARVKCAVLAWHTALDLLGGQEEEVLEDAID